MLFTSFTHNVKVPSLHIYEKCGQSGEGKSRDFEMWAWRKMKQVSWKDKKTNEEVLKSGGEKRTLT